MRIAIVCESDAEGGCREIHEPEELLTWLQDELAGRLGLLNRRNRVAKAVAEAFDAIEAEMRQKTVRVH
jgi:hypothetical protein